MQRAEHIGVSAIEPLRVVSLRHLGAGSAAVQAALAQLGLAAMPAPGRFVGRDPLVTWRSPSELTLLTTHADRAADALGRLRAGAHDEAYALDQTDASAAYALQGAAIDAWLQRLFDAQSVPREAGHGTRARLADVAVLVLRLAPDRAWLIADRAHRRYVERWLEHANGLPDNGVHG